MSTNQPAPVILSDEALAEIEIDHTQGAFRFYSNRRSVLALCQSLRALRTQLDDTAQLAAKAGENVDRLDKENTALREQLAEARDELRQNTISRSGEGEQDE